MHLRQLRYFVKIVDAGSFSRAASLVYVAQSALSCQIAELEEELGVLLLHRTPRGARPTAAGETLYREANAVLRLFGKIPESVRSTELAAAAGSVSLGMCSALASLLAGPFMKACREALPNVNLAFLSDDSVSLRNRMAQQKLDLALLFEAEPLPGLQRTELFRQQLFVLHTCPVRQHAAGLSLADLAQLPLILPAAPNVVRRLIDRGFAAAGLTPKVVAEIQDYSSAICAVKAGIGPTIVPRGDLSRVGTTDGVFVTPVDSAMRLTASIACAEDHSLSPAAEAVRALMLPFIKRYMREHQVPGAELLQQHAQRLVDEPSPLQMIAG